MHHVPRLVGLLQLILAIAAAIIATGYVAVPAEILAAIVAAQNALTGGARLRRTNGSHQEADLSEPPGN